MNISATQFDFAIPWDLLLKKMKAVDSDGFVNYEDFLRRFRVEFRPKGAKHSNWRMETIQRVNFVILLFDLNFLFVFLLIRCLNL